MAAKEEFRGVPGILRPFKEYLESYGIKKGDQIVYYGVPGTCTPFIELLSFAVRGLECEQIFVPMLEENKAQKIQGLPDIGMQIGTAVMSLHPKIIVIMGGLSMPNVQVQANQVKTVIEKHLGSKIVGVCFMNMFEKVGWLDTIRFDLLIDAMIKPVKVTRQ